MGNSAIELPRAPSGKAEKKVSRQPQASAGPAEMASVSRAPSGLAEHGLVFRAWRKWTRDKRRALADRVRQNHYAGNVPSGKSFYFEYEDAIVVYSIPANRISQGLLGKPNAVLELARLWAPDGHRPNLLTEAISASARWVREREPTCEAVISYADSAAGAHRPTRGSPQLPQTHLAVRRPSGPPGKKLGRARGPISMRTG
jgi:hypothetical protein